MIEFHFCPQCGSDDTYTYMETQMHAWTECLLRCHGCGKTTSLRAREDGQ